METTQVTEFIRGLTGTALEAAQAFEKKEAQKREAVDVVSVKLDGLKDEIREAMTFRVVDSKGKEKEKSISKKGQEHAIDTFGSVKKGHGISEEDWPKVQNAMSKVVELGRKLMDQNGFSDQEIADELFTPLVREGLLPETLVLGKFSEVQQLLNNTYSKYKETMEEARTDKLEKMARTRMDMTNGNAIDFFKGMASRAGELVDDLDPEFVRRAGVAFEGAKMGMAVGKGIKECVNWIPEEDGSIKNLTKADKFLNPGKYVALGKDHPLPKLDPESWGESDVVSIFDDDTKSMIDVSKMDPDALRTALAVSKLEKRYGKVLSGIMSSDATFHTKENCSVIFSSVIKDVVMGGVLGIKDIANMDKKLNAALAETNKRETAGWVVDQIDDALANAIQSIAATLSGLYAKEVDLSAIQDAAAPYPDGGKIVDELADGFESTLIAASPTFAELGKRITKAFRKKAKSEKLDKALKVEVDKDPRSYFEPIVAAAVSSIKASVTEEWLSSLQKDETLVTNIKERATFGDEEEMMEKLERSQEEIKEYEKMLVLIDEGGISVAEQKSIERLILKIKKDRATISAVKSLYSGIEGVTGSVVSQVAYHAEGLTDLGAQTIMAPIKVGKMILQLSLDVVAAAERHMILEKFRKDAKKSRVAVSSLTSTIQGFLDNKIEQAVFRDIDIALQAVQIAATIVGSVPDPITMAVGQTMSKVTSAVQQTASFAESLYNEVQLTKAWKATKVALSNPADRRAGLVALRLNPTLGMHAIAWAATKQPADPIARTVCNSLGLDEQTLAVSGTEEKVRKYLETVLNEDRSLIDSGGKIQTDWAPEDFDLRAKDWFTITRRAASKATPKLRLGAETEVFEALKPLDAHNIEKLKNGDLDKETFNRYLEEIESVCKALKSYSPVSEDGGEHDEMLNILIEFTTMANKYRQGLLDT